MRQRTAFPGICGESTRYLDEQQRARDRQLVAILADSYTRSGGWSTIDLRSLTPLAFMDGGTLRLLDASGGTVWAPSPDQLLGQMAQMHRQMMGDSPLGPERLLAITTGSRSARRSCGCRRRGSFPRTSRSGRP